MERKKEIIEFKEMLEGSEGEIPKVVRLLRNRHRLSQSALGALLGVHRNAIIRLEAGRYADGARWLRDLFLTLVILNDGALYKDICAIQDHAKNKTPLEPGEENSALFKDFLAKLAESQNNPSALSKMIRKDRDLTQEDLSLLLCTDRTTVTQLEGGKHKHPERLLADLYLTLLLLDDPELKEYVLTLKQEKIKKVRPRESKKAISSEVKPEGEIETVTAPAEYQGNSLATSPRAAEQEQVVPAPYYLVTGAGEGQPSINADGAAVKTGSPEELFNLKKYGFRTRQELYSAMRHGVNTLEEKRRLALIDTSWDDDLKKEEAKKRVRSQMKAVKEKMLRELFDRSANNQTAFIRASNSYRRGLSIAEVAHENNGYFSVPFCKLWEKQGFNLVKFLAWKPTEREIYEIYRDYEPEFRINTLEYKFRPKKNAPRERPLEEMNLNTLLKEWFPQIAAEIDALL